MRAKKIEGRRYLCGEPQAYGNKLGYLRVITAMNEASALFEYIEDRKDSLSPGDEVTVIELSSELHRFALLADEELPVEEVEADSE